MEAADGDPLRAQEMERDLNGLWYQRFFAWTDVKSRKIQKEQEKLKKEHEHIKRKARRSR